MRHIAFAVWVIFLCMAAEAKPLNVSVRAQSAILINPENGAILFQKGAHEAHYPASILKLATALYVLDGLQSDLDQKVVASSEALEVIRADIKQADFLLYPPYLLEHDGVMMGLKVGKTYTIRVLLYAVLLASGNDAANVLAEGVAGSIDYFIDGPNRYLKDKGVINTRFQNPSGLHHPAQLTTAADMAKIAALCFSNSHFREIIHSLKFESLNAENIQNTNRMLQRGRYWYPPLIGGKTGYTKSSGYNFVAAAEENGRQLIVVLLGCERSEDRFKDSFSSKKGEEDPFPKEFDYFL
jgi:D-alanyl-D-alanine carboxypeptidase (penicillin-binding protein 5/6)